MYATSSIPLTSIQDIQSKSLKDITENPELALGGRKYTVKPLNDGTFKVDKVSSGILDHISRPFKAIRDFFQRYTESKTWCGPTRANQMADVINKKGGFIRDFKSADIHKDIKKNIVTLGRTEYKHEGPNSPHGGQKLFLNGKWDQRYGEGSENKFNSLTNEEKADFYNLREIMWWDIGLQVADISNDDVLRSESDHIHGFKKTDTYRDRVVNYAQNSDIISMNNNAGINLFLDIKHSW